MKITYTNKVAIQNDESVDRKNKVTDEDMNEIKEVVNYNSQELENNKAKVEVLETQNINIAKDVSTNTTDISNIKQEQVAQNENISDLQEKNEKLEAKNIALEEENALLKEDLNNISVKGQASGENITIADSAEVRFPMLKIKGNSKQETRKGYNRLKNIATSKNYGGIDYKINDDGSVTVNGTSEGSYINIGKIIAKEGETYILTGCPSGGSSNGYMLTTNIEAGNRDHDKGEGVSFSYAEGTEISINLRVASGTVVSNLTFYPMVRLSTETETKYEKYGATPSTEYISEIRNTGDNANLYDKDNPNVLNTPIDTNGLGANAGDTYKTIYLKCMPNTTYAISKKYDETKNRFAVAYTDREPTYNMQVLGTVSGNTTTELTITTGGNAEYLVVYVWISGSSTTYQEILDSIKIEKGSKATSYSPHNCGNANINICNENYLDLNKVKPTTNATIEKTETGFIATRTSASTSDLFVASVELDLEKNQDYTIYENVSKQTILFIYQDRLFGKELPKTVLKSDSSTHCARFTTDKTGKVVIGFYSQGQTQGDTLTLSNIMICKGKKTEAEMKEYIKGKSQSFIFPLSEGQRLYKDSYLADDGIHHKRRQVVFNGTETKFVTVGQVNSVYRYNMSILDIKPGTGKAICSHYKQSNEANFALINENCIVTHPVSKVIAFFTSFPTLDEFKAYLAEQYSKGTPVIVEYELEEEIIEPYTEEQLKVYKEINKTARSYKGITHIFSTDEISPEFDVIYSKDFEILFNQVNSALVEGGM